MERCLEVFLDLKSAVLENMEYHLISGLIRIEHEKLYVQNITVIFKE